VKPAPDAPAEARISRYLEQIAAGLHGPRHQRRRILAELHDGLDQAITDHLARGLPSAQAVDAATAQFGTPRAIAAAFAGELATSYARHTVARFVATGPLVGIWWLLLLHPDPWRTGPIALLAAIPVIPLIFLGLATATGTLAATGRLIRWLPEAGPRPALTATFALALLAVLGDLAIIGGYLRSGTPLSPLAVLAVAGSLTRIGCSLIVIRRTTALRHR
jgi:hypothetical protein